MFVALGALGLVIVIPNRLFCSKVLTLPKTCYLVEVRCFQKIKRVLSSIGINGK